MPKYTGRSYNYPDSIPRSQQSSGAGLDGANGYITAPRQSFSYGGYQDSLRTPTYHPYASPKNSSIHTQLHYAPETKGNATDHKLSGTNDQVTAHRVKSHEDGRFGFNTKARFAEAYTNHGQQSNAFSSTAAAKSQLQPEAHAIESRSSYATNTATERWKTEARTYENKKIDIQPEYVPSYASKKI